MFHSTGIEREGPLPLAVTMADHYKTLRLYWDTIKETLHVMTPSVSTSSPPTMSIISSELARVYYILGWFSPVLFVAKALYQELWKRKLTWNETVPSDLAN